MKQRYPFHLTAFLLLLLFQAGNVWSQCGGSTTQARANWDNLDYYYNGGPYSAYISSAQARSQRFGIGSNYFTFAVSNDVTLYGDVTNHAGDVTVGGIAYTGADVQFQPTLLGQTFTITFNNEVQNASFTLYDIDRLASFTVVATNAAAVPQNVNVALQGTTILTVGGVPAARTITADATTLASPDNRGTATITVAGPVKTIVVTNTILGSDSHFWFSDIVACVTGSFPNNYQQTTDNEPFTGPAGNQPDYFLATPDNDSVYMVDPATGNAWFLFRDASKDYVNSLAYDPYHKYLYYISENVSVDANNRELKRYNLTTGVSSTIVANITTTLGIPTMGFGVESAGAAFYDGALYLGVEGGRNGSGGGTQTRETLFWRIELDASQNPTGVAYQVFGTDAYINATNTSIHDFGDFVIHNGILYDFNTARNSTNYSQSKYHHYNLMTGNMDALYTNPTTASWNGQGALTWTGDLYYFRGTTSGNSGIGFYNKAGVNSAIVAITPQGGANWPGGAGDASENFRPRCDFGDAPASYDPVANSPAVHERSDNLRLGASWDNEWAKTGGAGATLDGGDEDGIATVPLLDTGTFNFAVDIDVFNNTGVDATLGAWLDYNGNGVYDSGEGVIQTIGTSASTQTITLVWWTINTPLVIGQSTYLRVRITAGTNNMDENHATGYFNSGEVEDYQVMVASVLPVNLKHFDAQLNGRQVKTQWVTSNESNLGVFEVERSGDGNMWSSIGTIPALNQTGDHTYTFIDTLPLKGKSYYRLRITRKADGSTEKLSQTKSVTIMHKASLSVMPNPVRTWARLDLQSTQQGTGEVKILNMQGAVVYQKQLEVKEGLNTIQLDDLKRFQSGTYILQVKTPDELFNRQIIIQNE